MQEAQQEQTVVQTLTHMHTHIASVGEIIGSAADWYSSASVDCTPSDPHHQSDYSIKVSVLQSLNWILFRDNYRREKSAKSVEGTISEFENIYMFLAPLPDNMDEVHIDHCRAESKINEAEAKIPDYQINR